MMNMGVTKADRSLRSSFNACNAFQDLGPGLATGLAVKSLQLRRLASGGALHPAAG